jgi:Protein of unknown function (DUF2589)
MASVPALLKQLPLEHIIGAPLEAAIKSQAMAARTTVDFITNVGLKSDGNGDLVAQLVDFKFDRTLEEVQPNPTNGQPPLRNFRVVPSKLTVPLLAIVPIPFIRITDMTIDFEYKVRDIETNEHSDEFNVSAKVEAKYWIFKAEVSGSYGSKNAARRETDQSTTLRITVNAAQDNIPEGLARVLDMMHDQLKVVPLESGALQPQPTARIISVSPVSFPKSASNQVLTLKGEGLDAAKITPQAVPEDSTVTVASPQLPAGGTAGADLAVTVTVTSSTTVGEKTIRLATPNGIASVKVNVT